MRENGADSPEMGAVLASPARRDVGFAPYKVQSDAPGIGTHRRWFCWDVEDAVPYIAPVASGCRAGTCAPPFHRLIAAAHGWPPYGGADRIRRCSTGVWRSLRWIILYIMLLLLITTITTHFGECG